MGFTALVVTVGSVGIASEVVKVTLGLKLKRGLPMPKKWFKHWVAESLRGTIRFDLTSEERGVWWDLLAMAADSRNESYIAPNMEQGYPDAWIAATLNVPLKLLQRVIEKNEASGRIERTPLGLHIVNWSRYQSEYDRQKPYRQKSWDQQAEPTIHLPLAAAIKSYEDNIGQATPHIFEELKLLCDEYPGGWFDDAVKEATAQNKRSLSYIKGILKRWQSQGRDNSDKLPAPPKDKPAPKWGEGHEILFDEEGVSYYIGSEGMKVY